MKEGFDREIDSLLRRRARGTAELRSWGDGAGDGAQVAHLDADELSAFAEGALPSAARVAAASHLADCERCRGVVVGLARVAEAGAEVKLQAVAAVAAKESERTPAWRALFASLFSPRLMRLAVPVLALSLVGVVSYVALRSKGGASQVATTTGVRPGVLHDGENTATAPNAPVENANTSGILDQNTDASAKQEGAAAPAQPGQHATRSAADASAEAPDGGGPSAAAPPPPAPAPVTDSTATTAEGPAEEARAAPKAVATEDADVARSESRDRSDNKEKSQRAAEPADDNNANDAALARNRAAQSQSRMNQVQMPDGGATRNEKRADNNASGGYNVGGVAAAPRESEREGAGPRSDTRRGRSAKQGERKADDDESSRGGDGDMRSVAGHRFRREGNRWVDVNYKSDMRSTGVRRGTEGFRALVADVPVVGRVAEAIGGEVTVVVNGHAYVIR